MCSQYTSGVCVLVLDTKCATNPQSSSRGRPAVEKGSEWQIRFRWSACTYMYTYCVRVRVPYALVEFSSGITRTPARARLHARTCVRVSPLAWVHVGLRALAGCCVYASTAKDVSITRTHLDCRRVFCSRTFRMYYTCIYMYL